jgi:hypothetical protein
MQKKKKKNVASAMNALGIFFYEDGVGGLSGLNIGGGRGESLGQNMPLCPHPRVGMGVNLHGREGVMSIQ